MPTPRPAPKPPGQWRRRSLAVLLFALLVVASVLVRLPNLNRPLSPGAEANTARTLLALELWSRHGVERFGLVTPGTWQKPGDRGVPASPAETLGDTEGAFYYSADPPLAFLVPAGVLKLAGAAPGIMPLQLFGLAAGVLAAALLALLVARLFRGEPYAMAAGLWAAGVYLFSPAALVFHAHVYFTESFAQPVFLAVIWLAVRVAEAPEQRWRWAWLAAGLWLLTLTEWLGLFVLAAVWLEFAVGRRLVAHWRGLLLLTAATAGAVLTAAVLLGTRWTFGEAIGALFAKFAGTGAAWANARETWSAIASHYVALAVAACLLAAAQLLAALVVHRPWKGWLGSGETRLLWLLGGPVLMHAAALPAWSAREEMAMLKGLPLLAALGGLLLPRLLAGDGTRWRVALHTFGALVALGLSVAAYFTRYSPALHGKVLRDLGTVAARQARAEELVVLDGPAGAVEPQIAWYARRSVLRLPPTPEALQAHMARWGQTGAVILATDEKWALREVRRVPTASAPDQPAP